MNKFFLFIAFFAILISCSKEEIKESIIKEKSLDRGYEKIDWICIGKCFKKNWC